MSTEGSAGSTDGLDPAHRLSPGQYSTPTWARGVLAFWYFDPPTTGYYRFDALLTRPVAFHTPPPPGYTFVSAIEVLIDGFTAGLATSLDHPEGLVVDIGDLDGAWSVRAWGYYRHDTTGDVRFVDTYVVARVSDCHKETIQLPERDCLYVATDSANNEGDVAVAELWQGFFFGDAGFTRAFSAPYRSPGSREGAVLYAWDYARRRNKATFPTWYWTTGYLDGDPYTFEPSSPPPEEDPDYLVGLAGGYVGSILTWNNQDHIPLLLPATMRYHVHSECLALSHQELEVAAGPLGDGVPLEDALGTLKDYLSNPEGLPMQVLNLYEAADGTYVPQEIVAIQAKPDETSSSDYTDGPVDDQCSAVWLTSLPPILTEDEAPLWGAYLYPEDLGGGHIFYGLRESNAGAPEDWAGADPTLELLAVYNGGSADWVDIDVPSRLAYTTAMQAVMGVPDPDAYYFWVLPLSMWSGTPPDGAQGDVVNGSIAHLRHQPRVALKLHVVPAPFTAHYTPPLEPADPTFPEIVGAAGPNRATFWPQ